MKLRITALLLGVFLSLSGMVVNAQAEQNFSAAELKRMSTFLSNFTELGMRTFTAKEVLDLNNPYEMIHFGIWHNYMNNFNSRIKPAPMPLENGSLSISDKYVAESLKKYFNYTIKTFPSVKNMSGNPQREYEYLWKNGKYLFEGADGEGVYYARVQKAQVLADGIIQMEGYLYYVEDESDRNGTFVALARPHKFGGKNTWSIISMRVTQ